MSQPKVSVVVPCYNAGRFLPGLFASLAAQTFRDFETIVVDDGSTESATLAVLDALPPDVRLVRQSNQGLAAARNSGFRAACGEFVLPLDCDDALEPSFLHRAVMLLDSAPPDVGFVFTDMRLAGALGGVLERQFNRFNQLFHNRVPYCLLMRKAAWRKAGGYDASMRDGYEDWEFNIRLTLAGFKGVRIAEPLFVYCVSPDGMLMSRSARRHGRLWRAILKRHRSVYSWRNLRRLDRVWDDAGKHYTPFVGMLLVWGGRLLPASVVSAIFYNSLQTLHRLRVRRGLLSSPRAEINARGLRNE
ncbi:MAG TPA: glycosyltransferase family A protein [Pseudolabrys sp.]|nr:glycosyltransferase family A protein [Pseudolabrys sp.]